MNLNNPLKYYIQFYSSLLDIKKTEELAELKKILSMMCTHSQIPKKLKFFQKLQKAGLYIKSDKSLSRKENHAKVIMACDYT